MNNKTRSDYIQNLKVGSIVAYSNEKGMYTGKVIAVRDTEVSIQTKNGSIYVIPKESVAWVKLGSHWPIGIYNAIEASKKPNQEVGV